MSTTPQIATVADLQRSYRPLVTRLKKSGKPLFIVSNGKPDVVIMDVQTFESREKDFQDLEETYLLALATEASKESKQKKTIIAKPKETLMDILNQNGD
ncbi:hypothetical protein COT86_01795 [Candidatus Collierbacteria bacterium CG10_big_fil_rev_8_21_14_0_10_43_36]|uniref:Antitoxin n=3 Tax=Candidatus Collieribacteriota TaxID=1752725 RepID=A0A2H0DTR3_9BACT|nr:type II toxin-antitoxin system Phd/YefM family antitoxin [bacterium]PIP85514.1 MAG: hypothetical protein COW83_03785 [Candidatus Collierbacteria bacterium CG22_combo_CG10-13_8_21_14_all_43_12]PIR99822.1 MAG: hypothetical protein COT86_01795 [Candidatus Collierbacteria bacterium CG10_big_fil_rev_8_21_14_0_10_43_36]PIZ24704.1 MAG: hypothetical protein COY48_01460 [Candidatus Collierbacteria bacterium CG_4_10_14_0_8_um_filter_43_86]PJB47184.1 MAG: hypothetical protein CO104_04220 [Candidatus Co